MNQQQRQKRVKERFVGEALDLVNRWRTHYNTRFYKQNGKQIKLTLEQAAEVIGVPRKTLEDYYYQLQKASQLVNLDLVKDQKMGYIRKLVRESKIVKAETDQFINTEERVTGDSFEEALVYEEPSVQPQKEKLMIPQFLSDPQFINAQFWRQMMFELSKQQTQPELEMVFKMEDEEQEEEQQQQKQEE